jgi:hypothetical protein
MNRFLPRAVDEYQVRYSPHRGGADGRLELGKRGRGRLGKSIRLFTRSIYDERLKAELFGRSWAIAPAELTAFMAMPRYRPRKTSGNGGRKMK